MNASFSKPVRLASVRETPRSPTTSGVVATLAMPGSSNFVGEFMILLGVFQSKLAIAIIAFTGVVGAAYYALRLFISTMHNRVGPRVASRELRFADAAAIVPIVLAILALAFFPQFGLRRSQASVNRTIASAPGMLGGHPIRVAAR